jgi:ubiquitin-conjugating enzyme E2 M
MALIYLFQGFYRGGRFIFSFKVGPNYPHEPPKVKCETPVYHPNIDLEGNVCLNILREDWKPVLTINSIVYGLQYLFLVRYYLITLRSLPILLQLWRDIFS